MIAYEEAVELTMHILYDTLMGLQVQGRAILVNTEDFGTVMVPIRDFSIETNKLDNRNVTEIKAWIITSIGLNTERIWVCIDIDNSNVSMSKLDFMQDIQHKLNKMIHHVPDTELGRVLYEVGGQED